MQKKNLFIIGAVSSLIIFLIYYAYFWFMVGESSSKDDSFGAAVFLLIYFIAILITDILFVFSTYKTKNKSIVAAILSGIPILIYIIVLCAVENSGVRDLWMFIILGIFSAINFGAYFYSIFVKE